MRLSLLSILIFLFFPFSVQSLGLGELSVNSSLNSPLDAKIDLKSATPQDMESLDIRIASDRDFKRSDIEKVDLLHKLKFELITSDGSPYIHVTTNSVLREPIINFLIDIQWESGRLLREYTVFLDLPEVIQRKSTHSNNPPPVKSTSKTTKNSSIETQKFTSYSSDLSYGPTLETDTLWSVASRMRPSTGISMSQMMLAIQRENPNAFKKNNINGLMSGYTLRISSEAVLTQIDKANASSQVKEQDKLWKNSARGNSVDNVAAIEDNQINKQLVAADQDKSKLEILTNKQDKKTTDEDKTIRVKDKASMGLNKLEYDAKIALYEERIQTQTQENEELKNRIGELEKLIDKRDNLVELKSENLALLEEQQTEKIEPVAGDNNSLENETGAVKNITGNDQESYVFNKDLFTENNQTTIDSKTGVVDETDVEENKSEIATDIKEEVIVDNSTNQQPDNQRLLEDSNIEKSTLEKVTSEQVAGSISSTNEAEINSQETKKRANKTPKVVKPAVAPYKPESTLDTILGILSDIYKNYFIELLVAGGAFIALLLGSLFTRKKKLPQKDDFQESILTNSSISEDKEFENSNDNLDMADMGDSTGLEDETSFLSDFSSSELDGLQPDDVDADPISEADVFMVYGRYDQAEEMLKVAIERDPERLDYQMKLLDVFHGDKRQEGFVKQSAIIRNLIETSGTSIEGSKEWQKVGELGKDFDLGDSLATGASDDISTGTANLKISSNNDNLDIANLEPDDLSDDEIDVDDLERQLNEFEAMLNGDLEIDDAVEKAKEDLSIVQASRSSSLDDLPSLDDLDINDIEAKEENELIGEESLDDEVLADSSIEKAIDNSPAEFLEQSNQYLVDLPKQSKEVGVSLDDAKLDLGALSDSVEEPDISLEEESSEEKIPEVDSSEDDISLDDMELDLEDLSDAIEEPNRALVEESSEIDSSEDDISLDDMELDLEDLSDAIEEPNSALVEEISVIDSSEDDISLDDMELDLEDLSDAIEKPNSALVEEISVIDSFEDDISLDDMELDLEDLEDLSDAIEKPNSALVEEISVIDSFEDDISLDDMELDLDNLSTEDDLNLDEITDELDEISTDLSLEDTATFEDDIIELDEIGSTLDLAKARIEMGDEESKASAIKALELVINDGNAEQKAVAKKLLDLTR